MKSSLFLPRGLRIAALVLLAASFAVPQGAQAQVRTPDRQIRTYIPPDQLVSFLPSTPFDQFIEFLNPIFERVTRKTIVDPEGTTGPIGVAIAGMHFLDAFELVLEYNNLMYRETDRFFIVEEGEDPSIIVGAPETRRTDARAAGTGTAAPANLRTREIKINAVLFDLNHTKARDIGLDWSVFFGGATTGGAGGRGATGGTGSTSGIGGGGTGAGGTGAQTGGARFALRTDRFFDRFDDFLISPEVIEFATLARFFRLLETEGVGETIASPSITVQSGEQGRIQIGTDVPLNVRDFAGNTVTSFIQTGIIVDVTPTLLTEPIADTLGSPTMDFIHMNVHVENSNSSPTEAGPAINKSTANTQVVLLNGEQTIIGGLYSTDELRQRRGIPLLKDLPGWFFGLRYIFGTTTTTVNQTELLIVLQAEVVDPLQARANRPFEENLLGKHRAEVREAIRGVNERSAQEIDFPPVRGGDPEP